MEPYSDPQAINPSSTSEGLIKDILSQGLVKTIVLVLLTPTSRAWFQVPFRS